MAHKFLDKLPDNLISLTSENTSHAGYIEFQQSVI